MVDFLEKLLIGEFYSIVLKLAIFIGTMLAKDLGVDSGIPLGIWALKSRFYSIDYCRFSSIYSNSRTDFRLKYFFFKSILNGYFYD